VGSPGRPPARPRSGTKPQPSSSQVQPPRCAGGACCWPLGGCAAPALRHFPRHRPPRWRIDAIHRAHLTTRPLSQAPGRCWRIYRCHTWWAHWVHSAVWLTVERDQHVAAISAPLNWRSPVRVNSRAARPAEEHVASRGGSRNWPDRKQAHQRLAVLSVSPLATSRMPKVAATSLPCIASHAARPSPDIGGSTSPSPAHEEADRHGSEERVHH
jgi:hypothetical protein